MAQAKADAIIDALRGTAAATVALLVLLAVAWPQAQGTPPATPLTMLARDGRRPVPTTMVGGQELIALDDVATLFRATVREDALAGGVTLTYSGRTIVASADQAMASVSGRVVTLPSPVIRAGRRWLVPVEFLSRALAPIYDQRIELRRPSRLLIVGDLRVPRVTARIDAAGPPTRATVEIAPPAAVVSTIESGRVLLRIDADALDLALPAGGGGLIEQIRAGDAANTVAVAVNATASARATVTTTADNARASPSTCCRLEHRQIAAPQRPARPPPPPSRRSSPAARSALQTIVIDPGHGGDDIGARGQRRPRGESVHARRRPPPPRRDRDAARHPGGADARRRPRRQPRRTRGDCQQQQGRPVPQPACAMRRCRPT